MSVACGWSLGRSLLVAILAAPVCLWLERRLGRSSGRARQVVWAALLLPFLFPTLLSGYAYTGAGLQVVNSAVLERLTATWTPEWRQWLTRQNSTVDEALLGLLLLAKSVPVGTLVLTFAPRAPYSPAARHCRRLADQRSRGAWERTREWAAYLRYGPSRSLFAALGLMSLVCFQEFELPALLVRPAWTVWLFVKQFEGLALSESLRAALLPVLCQVAVVVPLWRGLIRYGGEPRSATEISRRDTSAAWRDGIYLVAAILLTCVVPLSLIGRETVDGARALVANRVQFDRTVREIVIGVFLSLLAALAALRLVEMGPRRRVLRQGVACLALPGLFGSLVLSLALVGMLQWRGLNLLYRTPVSYIAGIVLFLLPRALLLQAVVQATRPQQARHTVSLLAQADDPQRRTTAYDLAWRLGTSSRFWSVALLTFWGYLELTVAYLLGAEAIVSVPVLLYNQMHTGKNAILSAQICLAVTVPALLFFGVAALRPLLLRWFWR